MYIATAEYTVLTAGDALQMHTTDVSILQTRLITVIIIINLKPPPPPFPNQDKVSSSIVPNPQNQSNMCKKKGDFSQGGFTVTDLTNSINMIL